MKHALCILVSLAAIGCASAPEEPEGARTETATILTPAPMTPPARDPILDSASYAAALAALGDISSGQYVEAGACEIATISDTAYEGFDVKRCVYEDGGMKAVVYALNPSGEDVARWISGACASVEREEDAACAQKLAKRMRISNSFIFPVAGDVLEKARDAGPGCAARYGDRIVHVYFRDGVTIETARGYTCETYEISEADADAEAFKAPAEVFNVGRIAALHRNDYARLAGVPRPSDDEWRAIVRDSYLNALSTGRYSLLDMVAKDIFGA